MITLGTSNLASRWRILALASCLLIPGQLLAQEAAVHAAETATADMTQLMGDGQGLYNTHCAACHQPTGQGLAAACQVRLPDGKSIASAGNGAKRADR